MIFGSLLFHSQKHKKLFLRVKNDQKIYPIKARGRGGMKVKKKDKWKL